MPSFTTNLEETLHRAVHYANERKHEYATLEHLLLALTDDPEAREAMIACEANPEVIEADCLRYIDNDLKALIVSDGEDCKPTAGFQRVVQRAVIHVQTAGREDVTGANILVALFSERESHAAHFLSEQGLTRFDVVNYVTYGHKKSDKDARSIISEIEKSKERSPEIQIRDERLSYVQRSPELASNIDRKRNYLEDELNDLSQMCVGIDNTHPYLSRSLLRYRDALEQTTQNTGAYELFMLGIKLEQYFRMMRSEAPTEEPRLDHSVIVAFGSFFPAHAAFVSTFPDVSNTMSELDVYNESLDKVDTLLERTADPLIDYLARSRNIFDEKTSSIVKGVRDLKPNSADPAPYRAEQAAKHSWLRGIFAAMGEIVIKSTKGIGKSLRDAGAKEAAGAAVRNHEVLIASIVRFFHQCRDHIIALSHKMSHAFGWLSDFIARFIDVP